MEEAIYTVELTSSYPEWWRYNLYLSVIEFDKNGERTGYCNAVDRVYEIEDGAGRNIRQAPSDWGSGGEWGIRKVSVTTGPCDHIAIYLYVIANTFPESALIRDSPPFPAELAVRKIITGDISNDPGQEIFRQTYDVNQWGGLTIGGLRIGSPATTE